MDGGLRLDHLLHKLLNPILIEKSFCFPALPLIGQGNGETGIKKGELPHSLGQQVELKLGRIGKNDRIRLKGDLGPGLF